jgi:N-methylhydantoinase A
MAPGAVAVCLLFSYRNPAHEQRIGAALRDAGFDVSLSHEVLPEHREYERASTTAIDAFLRPTVRGYLARIEAHAATLRVMHSGAGITTADAAGERPTAMVLSGPAGGVLGAVAVAGAAGIGDIVTFDMGGTSTDVALCTGGQPHLRNSAIVDGMALHAPMVDIETVGAGGGSIAWLDEGGALRVGPRSAGADPGPASYGRGGVEPTVSDANVALGRLRPERFLGGGMALDAEAAGNALARLGDPGQAARAVIEVVNANMARALRAVSLERGFDPAAFTLVAFGGAGPLHACELAALVGMPRVLVPRYPGVLSALGMVTAAEALERSQGLLLPLDDGAAEPLATAAIALEAETHDAADTAGTGRSAIEWIADARYRGQAHELRVAIDAPRLDAIIPAFHDAHRERFGYHLPEGTVELVTLRARIAAEVPPFPLTPQPVIPGDAQPDSTVEVVFGESDVPVQAACFERTSLGAGARVTGPAIITQDDATTVVPPGWRGEVDTWLNLLLERTDGD